MRLIKGFRNVISFHTDFTCPRCRGYTEFFEDRERVWLGCERCRKWVYMEKQEAWNVFEEDGWRGLMGELTKAFSKYVTRG